MSGPPGHAVLASARRARYRLGMSILRHSRVLLPVLLLVAACSNDESGTTSTSTSSSATTSSAAQGSGGSGGQGGDGGQGGQSTSVTTSSGQGGSASSGQGGGGGAEDLGALLVGDWKPTGFEDSGMGFKPANPNDPFFVFGADNKMSLTGCGMAPNATWSFVAGGVPGALGVITIMFGQTTIKWYVVELTATKFVFAEGGDKFYFERSTCM